jgi:ADP-ribose pyrophosphatase YjhB (NUDIX family)
VELGESLVEAVVREAREETGLAVEAGPVIETFDRVHRDADGRIRFHFVIVDFACRAPEGDAVAGSDAEAVAWVTADDLDGYGVNPHAAAVIRKGIQASGSWL